MKGEKPVVLLYDLFFPHPIWQSVTNSGQSAGLKSVFHLALRSIPSTIHITEKKGSDRDEENQLYISHHLIRGIRYNQRSKTTYITYFA